MKRFIQSRDVGIKFAPPIAVINNPGQYVFPGGEVKPGEKPFDAAIRKFMETTGVKFEVDPTKTTITYDKTIFPIFFDETTTTNGYNCLFMKVPNKNLKDLVKTIQTNLSVDPGVTLNDELIYVGMIELEKNLKRIPSPDITSYCTTHAADLKLPRDLATWRTFFTGANGKDLVTPPGVTNISQPHAATLIIQEDLPHVQNISLFIKQCYDMGPFIQFMINPKNVLDFPADAKTGKKEYAFIKDTDTNNLPSRYSTDCFLQISEKIPVIDSMMDPKKE